MYASRGLWRLNDDFHVGGTRRAKDAYYFYRTPGFTFFQKRSTLPKKMYIYAWTYDAECLSVWLVLYGHFHLVLSVSIFVFGLLYCPCIFLASVLYFLPFRMLMFMSSHGWCCVDTLIWSVSVHICLWSFVLSLSLSIVRVVFPSLHVVCWSFYGW